jgi:hypothetical protein
MRTRTLQVYDDFFFGPKGDPQGAGHASRRLDTSSAAADPLPSLLESLLPYYSEASIAMRELLHDRADDDAWRWDKTNGQLTLTRSPTDPNRSLTVVSVVPGLWTFDEIREEDMPLLVALLMAALGSLAMMTAAIAWFLGRYVFLIDLPIWSSSRDALSRPTQSQFVVCRRGEARGRYERARGFYRIDFARLCEATSEELNATLHSIDTLLPQQPILIDHFEERLHEPQCNLMKLTLLEELVLVRGRTVLVLSTIRPTLLRRRAQTAHAFAVERRWDTLLTSFVTVDLDPAFALTQLPGDGAPTVEEKGVDSKAVKELHKETDSDSYLRGIYDDVERLVTQGTVTDLEQLRDEVAARAATYYLGIWVCCSPAEKIVLQHLAEQGFVNYRDRSVIRRLVAGGLIQRDPTFRVFNETFRRFVLSRMCRADVAEIKRTRTSTWDRIQLPFAAALLLGIALLVVTQKEHIETTMAVVTAMTGLLPALIKLAGMVVSGRQEPERN